MTSFLSGLIIGLFVGGMVGVFVMCLVFVNRAFEFDDELFVQRLEKAQKKKAGSLNDEFNSSDEATSP